MCLSYPETIPHPSSIQGKVVFYEAGPWCQNGWLPLLEVATNRLRSPRSKHLPLQLMQSACDEFLYVILNLRINTSQESGE